MKSYTQKKIDLVFELQQGTFAGTQYNTLRLSGLRVDAQLANVLQPGATNALLRIYGMTPSQMNTLTSAGNQYSPDRSTVRVYAGDQNGMSQVFVGNVIEAQADFSGMPEVGFVVSAVAGADINLKPSPSYSGAGGVAVSTILQAMASAAGLQFEDGGVTGQIRDPYFWGSLGQQINEVATAANVFVYIDLVKNVLAAWPKNGNRGGQPVTISPSTGMVGYPSFQNVTLRVRTLFSPAAGLYIGGKVNVQSALPAANGLWNITGLDLALSSIEVDGPWEALVTAVNANAPASPQF